MKPAHLLTLLFWFLLCTCVRAQTDESLRYFQFRIACGHGNWQDTAVVAATNDTNLIHAFQAQLGKPFDERQFINGPIAHGDGGHNANADHRFAWHFVPNQWELVDLAIEVCSGCPFTDLDSDPTYWVDTLGLFCPWSARPVREIEGPLTGTRPGPVGNMPFSVYPNPVGTFFTVELDVDRDAMMLLHNAYGRTVLHLPLSGPANRIDVRELPRGAYYIELRSPTGSWAIRPLILK